MLVCLAALALCTPPRAGEWTLLETPALCAAPAPSVDPLPLLDGVHILLRPRSGELARGAPQARLPLPLVTQMLEELARSRSAKLEFLRSAPGLLVRGDDELVQAARALLADLSAQGERLEIDLGCELTPRAGGEEPGLRGKARLRSGDEVFFGARRTRAFVSGYDVEVAADSGVAQPTHGSALYGPSVHVRATRVAGGKKIHVQGLLDLSELGDVERFEPGGSDLGVIEEPSVACVQVVFAGVLDSGGTLDVTIQGAPLKRPDWKLTLTASTRPDPEPSAEPGGWSMLDLSFLASEPRALTPATPGGQLAREGNFESTTPAPQSLPASAVAATLEQARSASSSGSSAAPGRGGRAPMFWTSDLLLVPRGDLALAREARALVSAAESARLASGRVELKRGTLSVSLPCCEGHPARVLAIRQRPYLTEYTSELAPQTWMPAPQIELVSDGLRVDLAPAGSVLACQAWCAESEPALELPKLDVKLGKLQQLRRALWTESARVQRKESGRTLFAPAPAGPGALSIGFDAP